MIDGTKLTLIPQLSEGKTYSVTLPKGSIVGVNGASFDGLATYTLTTTDTTEPVVMRTIPPMNGEVAPGTQVELVFNKPIVATGNWTVTLTWEDRVEEVEVENVVIEENHLIVPVGLFNYKQCVLEIAEGSIADLFGNENLDAVQLAFRTAGTCGNVP